MVRQWYHNTPVDIARYICSGPVNIANYLQMAQASRKSHIHWTSPGHWVQFNPKLSIKSANTMNALNFKDQQLK